MYEENKALDNNTIKLDSYDEFEKFIERIRVACKLYDDKNIQRKIRNLGKILGSYKYSFSGLQNLHDEITILSIIRLQIPKESYGFKVTSKLLSEKIKLYDKQTKILNAAILGLPIIQLPLPIGIDESDKEDIVQKLKYRINGGPRGIDESTMLYSIRHDCVVNINKNTMVDGISSSSLVKGVLTGGSSLNPIEIYRSFDKYSSDDTYTRYQISRFNFDESQVLSPKKLKEMQASARGLVDEYNLCKKYKYNLSVAEKLVKEKYNNINEKNAIIKSLDVCIEKYDSKVRDLDKQVEALAEEFKLEVAHQRKMLIEAREGKKQLTDISKKNGQRNKVYGDNLNGTYDDLEEKVQAPSFPGVEIPDVYPEVSLSNTSEEYQKFTKARNTLDDFLERKSSYESEEEFKKAVERELKDFGKNYYEIIENISDIRFNFKATAQIEKIINKVKSYEQRKKIDLLATRDNGLTIFENSVLKELISLENKKIDSPELRCEVEYYLLRYKKLASAINMIPEKVPAVAVEGKENSEESMVYLPYQKKLEIIDSLKENYCINTSLYQEVEALKKEQLKQKKY